MTTKVLLNYSVLGFISTYSVLFGQSTFELNNRLLPVGINAPVFDAQSVPLEGTNYLAELYGGLSPDALTPALDQISRNRVIVPFRVQGYFTTGFVLILSVPPGSSAWLQVRAWDARFGATYEEASARGLGGYGESALFYARGGGASPNGDLSGPLIGLQSFRLRPFTPAVLVRSVRREGNKLVVELNPGFKRYQLQQASALGQPWQNVGEPTAATSVTNSITGGTQFFRVIALLE